MYESLQATDCKDHWEEKEIILERSIVDDITSLGFAIAGGNDRPIVKNFAYIVVVRIIENGLADIDKQLRLYDIILRVNDTDYSNIKHQTAAERLKMSGKKVALRIRRLTPRFMEIIELEHESGKLGIAIEGGIGSEYFKGEAKKRIGLACSDSPKVKLTVSNHTRTPIRVTQKPIILHSDQHNPRATKDERVDELNLNNNQICQISTNISKCKRLKILRLDNNKLMLKSIPISLLKNSIVYQLSINGNLFDETQFQLVEGYDDYERRYTANQRKRDATAILLLT
ncbi:hypothetical protein I4U23_022980 [Adineta vaga]|nr:hypothetical protein I4U23_022980 [Adineta vaga]